MNYYFLVEGRQTERKIYPAWIKAFFPGLIRVDNASDVKENNYYLISGGGQPSILNYLINAIKEVNEIKKYSKLILVMDAEEDSVQTKHIEVSNHLKRNGIDMQYIQAELVIIVQNRCIETWLLGNRKIFKRNPSDKELSTYISFYNTYENDPEKMGCYPGFTKHAFYHLKYLKLMLKERNLVYTKKNPGEAMNIDYFNALCDRVDNDPGSLKSFQVLLSLFNEMKNELKLS